jgi:hypothetical protein
LTVRYRPLRPMTMSHSRIRSGPCPINSTSLWHIIATSSAGFEGSVIITVRIVYWLCLYSSYTWWKSKL